MKKYPVDKFPTVVLRPEVVARHEEHLQELKDDLEGYSKIGGRDQSGFDWLVMVLENLGLSTVKDQYLDSLVVTKTRIIIFTVLIDDPVDDIKKRNFRLFEELVKIPFNSKDVEDSKFNSDELKYFEYAKQLWPKIINEIKTYPHYEKYKDAFEFDLIQLINSMRYSRFVNTLPKAINLIENDAYVHHSMAILIQMDLDLMCSENFNDDELGKLRELVHVSQKMAKIGNLIATYPRELIEADMSSEALVKFQKYYGPDFKFKINKLLNRESRYPKFEDRLIQKWEKKYLRAKKLALKVKSIDGDRFLKEREFIQNAYRMNLSEW